MIDDLEVKECCYTCCHYNGTYCCREWNNLDPDYCIPERDERKPDDYCDNYEWGN
ncbi:MAG: hypothetical protein J6S14_07220 [Clostridia bacterium]|nr:hypothetical protein [Clostridia bacterium]